MIHDTCLCFICILSGSVICGSSELDSSSAAGCITCSIVSSGFENCGCCGTGTSIQLVAWREEDVVETVVVHLDIGGSSIASSSSCSPESSASSFGIAISSPCGGP